MKTPRKALEKELDKLWSQIAHRKWGERCAWPGCTQTERLSPHHFYHKSQGNFARYSVDNSILLCFGHHIRQVHQRGNTEPIREVLIQKIGEERFNQLRRDVKQTLKMGIDQLRGLESFFQALLSPQSIGGTSCNADARK
jgi:hypothetical protein